MMGAGNVKAVYARWGHLRPAAFRLLVYIAVTIPDRERRPRCELSRESMARGLGHETFDETAGRAVDRAISSLRVAGALSVAQLAAPGRRCHYWVNLSMEHPTNRGPDPSPPVDGTDDKSRSRSSQQESMERTTNRGATVPQTVGRRPSDTVLPRSGQELQEKYVRAAARAASSPPPDSQAHSPHLHAISGGSPVTHNHARAQPGLWPAPVPDPAGDPPSVTAQTIVGEWIDRCAKRPPGRVVGQVSKYIREMLGEGVAPDDIRRGTAAWMAKGLHPAALASVVNEVMNRGPAPARPSTTDQRVADTLALGARLQAELDRKALPG